MRRDARGSHHRQAGGASRQNPFEHVLNPLWFAVSGESGDAPGRQEDMVEGGSDSLMTGAAATSRPACRSGTSLPTSRPACRSGTSLPTSRPACRSDSIGTAGSAGTLPCPISSQSCQQVLVQVEGGAAVAHAQVAAIGLGG